MEAVAAAAEAEAAAMEAVAAAAVVAKAGAAAAAAAAALAVVVYRRDRCGPPSPRWASSVPRGARVRLPRRSPASGIANSLTLDCTASGHAASGGR